jgi:hypothetical protein
MVGINNKLIITFFILSFAIVPITGNSQLVFAQDETKTEAADSDQTETTAAEIPQIEIDQEALDILKDMSDALISAKEFTFDTEITNDRTLDSGQTIQYSGTMATSVKRPNDVYAKFIGDSGTREVWSSGTELTLYNASKQFYGVLKTPDSIDATMDFLIDNYDFTLALADILNANPYDSFMETTIGGFVVGDSIVRGVECSHLAFIGEYVDWQIWISNEDPALPYKFVINYKEIEGVPQYQAIFSNWNLKPKLSESTFKAAVPKDAVKIDFINYKKEKEADNNEEK